MSDDEVRRHLAQTSGWHAADGAIEKTFAFKGWLETVAFVDALAWICHVEDHHPELRVSLRPLHHPLLDPLGRRRLASTTSSAPPRPMPSSPSSAEREGRVVSGHGRHVVVEAGDGSRTLCHAPRQEERDRRRRPGALAAERRRRRRRGGAAAAEPPLSPGRVEDQGVRRQPRPAARRRRRRAGVQRIAAGARPDRRRGRAASRAAIVLNKQRPADLGGGRGAARALRGDRHRGDRRGAEEGAGPARDAGSRRSSPAARRSSSGRAAPARARSSTCSSPTPRRRSARSRRRSTPAGTRPRRPTGTGSTPRAERADRLARLPGIRPAPHRRGRARRADARHRPARGRMPLLQLHATSTSRAAACSAALARGEIAESRYRIYREILAELRPDGVRRWRREPVGLNLFAADWN